MNKKVPFLKRISKGPILFDGGLGTEFYSRGVFINKCYEELNITTPNLVKQVYEDYKKAGADVLETNTFGANFYKLASYGLADQLYQINYQGAKLAKEVAGDDIYVAGSIGPLGIQIEPLGKTSYLEAKNAYKNQLIGLIEGGVDLIIFETFINVETLKTAVEACKEVCNLPIIAQITIDDDGSTLTGASPELIVKELEELNVDVIGVNCTVGPQVMLEWLEIARQYTKLPISVMPNAGKPKNIEGRNFYLTSPEYLGEYTKHFINAGANVIGGCCGTTPEHIKKMRNMVDSIQPDLKKTKIKITSKTKIENIEPIVGFKKSRLARKLNDGHFVKFVELLAPRGIDASKELDKAKEMHYYGIDVINIPDGPRASARMSALSLALQIQNTVHIETVLHFVCRDRNVIGMQSDLMGAYALGVNNILAITGDPPKLGNYPDATAVFDVDSIGLVNILNRLNHGMDIAGNPIGNPTGFFVGVGANPCAIDLDKEIERLKWKVEAGAEYIVTQPIFDKDSFYKFLDLTSWVTIPIIAGIWPLVSFRNAEFMKNEVPGVVIPDRVMERMFKYKDSKEDGMREGIFIAQEIISEIKNDIRGLQISAPFGKVEAVMDVLDPFTFD